MTKAIHTAIGVCATAMVVLVLFSLDPNSRPEPQVRLASGGLSEIDAGCGPIAVAVVSRWFDNPGTIEAFTNASDAGQLGETSLADLKTSLNHWGLCAEGVRFGRAEVVPESGVLIMHVRGNHFWVAVPVRRDTFLIIDPPSRPNVRARKELNAVWDGDALVVARTTEELRVCLDRLKVRRAY